VRIESSETRTFAIFYSIRCQIIILLTNLNVIFTSHITNIIGNHLNITILKINILVQIEEFD